MAKRPPKTVTLDHDDYHAEYVGRTKDGRQFFLTTPFVPAEEVGTPTGREFIALYVFDKAGQLVSATIDDLGPRATMDEAARVARRDELLSSLGEVQYRRIKVAPFRVEMFGVEFGFIAWPPEEPGENWCVTVEPGDYMCFWPPWTGGDYDT
jgi:hypothetical protein